MVSRTIGAAVAAAVVLSGCTSTVSGQGAAASAQSFLTTTITAAPRTETVTATPSSARSTKITAAPTTVTASEEARATGISSSAIATATATAQAADIMGPFGYDGVKLGMTPTQAAATGIFVSTPAVGKSCQSWQAIASAPIAGIDISHDLGVILIDPKPGADYRTPEGMTAGWTAARVHAAYPSFNVSDAHEEDDGPVIKATGNPAGGYRVQFNSADRVVGFNLQLATEDCFD